MSSALVCRLLRSWFLLRRMGWLCSLSILLAYMAHAQDTTPMRYLALGDSYTIGESVAVAERWPVQLAAQVRAQGFALGEPQIIARTGWTTDELMAALTGQAPQGPFALVSLLIGVNNQYRGRSSAEYRMQLRQLLDTAMSLAGGRPERVLVLSIPDWGVTPFAGSSRRAAIATAIDLFNTVKREETARLGAHYVDITPLSRRALHDPTLLAPDGLHPSGSMYTQWVALALPTALHILRTETAGASADGRKP